MDYLEVRDRKICFSDQGSGKCLVLLHGFTECSLIWNSFVETLSGRFRVITVDLPGFGESDNLSRVHTMDLMALVVRKIMVKQGVKQCVLAGHSMGGYAALAFARKYPKMLRGLCLFHSQPYGDTLESKIAREKMIDVIKADKFNFLVQFIPGLFPEETRHRYKDEISVLIRRAKKISKEAVLAAMTGMKERRDSSWVMKDLKVPVLFIIGQKDPRIPPDRTGEMLALARHTEALILKDVGHMGFIEAEKETLNTLAGFTERCYP